MTWKPLTRIAFRFCFVYFGLFCLLTPPLVFVLTGWFGRRLGYDAQYWHIRKMQPALNWVSEHLFGTAAQLYPNGVGDQTICWVLLFCILVVAVTGTAVWSILDRRRTHYRTLAGWYLLGIRLMLAGQMASFGFAKLIPTQMPQPSLTRLLTKYGDFTPMAVLWSQVGVSRPYEMLLGAAEVAAAILLFIPRTALLGALLTLIDTLQIVVLNMTFDVPEKISSTHLLLMSLLLLAPEARRLTQALLLNRATDPSVAPYPFHATRSRRIAALAQAALGIWIAVALAQGGWHAWRGGGPDRPEPPLYGIWSVSQYTRDGQPAPPLTTDETRWKTVIFDDPNTVTYQRMDDTLTTVPTNVDPATHRIQLLAATQPPEPASSLGDTRTPLGTLTFQQPTPNQAVLTGELNGHQVTLTLNRVDPNNFPQRSTPFHWVQNRPNL
ncbi:DoxX family protein [Nocardia terpenica]|uniref:DoxX family protein n=1 Tax=Nocardia terpenica TaxID=455432 RepID=A0A6G9Z6W6_9NOCA|nr:DoxX family protein [Nocardia terpenica]QIS21355.1 DoxX family protein [Nocardia terpenica]